MFNAQTEGGGWHGNGGMAGLELWNLCLTEKTKSNILTFFFAISPTTEKYAWRTEEFDQFDIVLD